MPLLGAYEHSVGPNGRMIIPAKLRAGLGEDFVAVAAFDSLHLFPMQRWLEIEDRLRERNPLADSTTELLEYLGENSALCSQDKQGRTTIPQELLDRVGLKGDIVSVGSVDRIRVRPKQAHMARPRKGEAEVRALIGEVLG
jgi:MraZ protein